MNAKTKNKYIIYFLDANFIINIIIIVLNFTVIIFINKSFFVLGQEVTFLYFLRRRIKNEKSI